MSCSRTQRSDTGESRVKHSTTEPLRPWMMLFSCSYAGVAPGFLGRGFIGIKRWGPLCCFYLISFLIETKLFLFHRIFKNWGGEGVVGGGVGSSN